MAKEDIQWAVLGILILIVVALVIKPMATGEPPNIGLPTATPTSTPEVPIVYPTITSTPIPISITMTITPTSTWPGTPQKVEFVDPSTYQVNLSDFSPRITPTATPNINDCSNLSDIRTTKYISLLSEPIEQQNSSTTGVIDIPVPYWEIWYSFETVSSDLVKQSAPSAKYVVTPTKGSGISKSGYQGSYSTAMPEFKIIVMDYNDPNRIIRTIDPGDIDPKYWKSGESVWKKSDDGSFDLFVGKGREKFYEGYGKYYLIIYAKLLKSYTIEITTPKKYDPKCIN